MKLSDPFLPRIELAEWQSRSIPGAILSDADRRLSRELQSHEDRRLTVEEMRDTVRITARSWVGVVRFEQFEVCIVPKLAGNALGLIQMLKFASGLESLSRASSRRTIATKGLGLFDLVALLLAEACDQILRGGILSDYVEREEDLSVVRGRLLGDQQVLRQFGRIDRLNCRFDEHEQDIPENQLLAFALSHCASRVRDAAVRRRVRMLRGIFQDVCRADTLDVSAARANLVYHRLNERYRDAHTLAWLVLDGLQVTDLLAPGATNSFAFMIDMNMLFEVFVYRLIDRLCRLASLQVHYQRRDPSIILNMATMRSYARVIPDLLVEPITGDRSVRVPVDAKYKLYDERKLDSSDVYQSFLYAYAYGPHHGPNPPTAVLVYPSSYGSTRATHLCVRNTQGIAAAELLALGVSIPGALAEVKQDICGPVLQPVLEAIQRALGRFNARATVAVRVGL